MQLTYNTGETLKNKEFKLCRHYATSENLFYRGTTSQLNKLGISIGRSRDKGF